MAWDLKRLSIGLLFLAGWMGFQALAGLMVPVTSGPSSETVNWWQESPVDIASTVAILLIPILGLALVGVSLRSLRATVPEVRRRLTWRLRSRALGPLGVLVLLFLLEGFLFAVQGFVALSQVGGGTRSAAFLLLYSAFEAVLVPIGWCIMVFPARALAPWTTRAEGKAVTVAVLAITAGAVFEMAMQFVAAGVGASMLAANPTANLPPRYPRVDGIASLASFIGLLIAAWIARRIVHRTGRSAVPAVPLTA